MTKFICQELLYEFATGRLDLERQKAMDVHLTDCRESQRELDRLKKGLNFAAFATQVRVTPKLREALLGFEPQWKRRLAATTLWSSQRGWKIFPYVFLSLALIMGLAVWKPWHQPEHNDVTLVEQLKAEPDMVPPGAVPVTSTVFAAPTPTPPVNAATRAAEVAEATAPEKTKPAPATAAGALTRGDLEVSDFPAASAAIREKILALGGKVAGSVELGWLKRKGESYFHFSIPENRREELELFLKTFGPVRFAKEPHSRVMPEGQIRIILTVKDGTTNDSREEAETP